MTDSQEILIIILVILLSVFFTLCIVAIVILIKLLSGLRLIVSKAEEAIDSVESAAEAIKNTQGKLAIIRLVNNIFKMTLNKRDK